MMDKISRDGRTWKEHFPEGDLWVFGYGFVVDMTFTARIELTTFRSLIWKPPPHFGWSYLHDMITENKLD